MLHYRRSTYKNLFLDTERGQFENEIKKIISTPRSPCGLGGASALLLDFQDLDSFSSSSRYSLLLPLPCPQACALPWGNGHREKKAFYKELAPIVREAVESKIRSVYQQVQDLGELMMQFQFRGWQPGDLGELMECKEILKKCHRSVMKQTYDFSWGREK